MRFFETIKKRHEEKKVAKAQKLEEERLQQEQERLAQEQARKLKLEEERKRAEEAKFKIMAKPVPYDCLLALTSYNHSSKINGITYEYPRIDLFVTEIPIADMGCMAEGTIVKCISGQNFGKCYRLHDSRYGFYNVYLFDGRGHRYEGETYKECLQAVDISELNERYESVNSQLKKYAEDRALNKNSSSSIKNDIFNL